MQTIVLLATTRLPTAQLPPSMTQLFGHPSGLNLFTDRAHGTYHKGHTLTVSDPNLSSPQQQTQLLAAAQPLSLRLPTLGPDRGQSAADDSWLDVVVDDVIQPEGDVLGPRSPAAEERTQGPRLQTQANEADIQAGTELAQMVRETCLPLPKHAWSITPCPQQHLHARQQAIKLLQTYLQ